MLARQRKGWRQKDLAAAAGVSQQLVAIAESGALERLTVRALRKIAAPLEIRLPFGPLWNGGEADRLRDRDHAALVEQVTTILRRHYWEVVVENTFSHYGERGSIDLVGWHPVARTLLVVEVKTRIYDVQALVAGIDRKARLARQLVPAERGWRAEVVARVVVVPERSANRSLIGRHSQLFEAAMPERSRAIRAWLCRPTRPMSGLWFLSSTNRVGGIQIQVGRQRVRVRASRASAPRDSRSTNLVGG